MTDIVLETERLLLRPWRDDDRAPFAAMLADPTVREFFPRALSREESDAFFADISAFLAREPYGLWAVEVKSTPFGERIPFIGYVGLSRPRWEAEFTPCVEVGWSLAPAAWGQGYATEGAQAALRHGFLGCGLDEIVSFTYRGNWRSRRVMERIGMLHDASHDFMHPNLDESSPLRPHVYYRLSRERWEGLAYHANAG